MSKSEKTPHEIPVSEHRTWNEGYTGESFGDPTQSTKPGTPDSPKDGGPSRKDHLAALAKTFKPEDFLSVHRSPCAREGLLVGIGCGAAMLGIRWTMGAAIKKASNWAVGTFVLTSIGEYKYCQLKRQTERLKMRKVIEVRTKAQAEARAREAEQRLLKQKEEEAQELQRKQSMSWYRFW